MTHIAVVTLAPGQVGFYDDLSGIHLSLTNTEASITEGMNTAGLVNAVKAGKITVVSGSLGTETFVYQEAAQCMPTYYRLLEKKKIKALKNQMIKPVKISEPKVENPIKNKKTEIEVELTEHVEEPKATKVIEEKVAEVKEKVVEEKVAPAPKKRTRKKKEVVAEEVKED
jgi:hypothetical protein|nr:MAG TPA: hypothetical protein [Caudoviricetes sp.]